MQNSPLFLFQKHKERLYRIGGYIAFGILIFTVSIFLTFPSGKIASTISRAIEGQSGLKVSIKKVTPRLPMGISAKEISIKDLNGKTHKLDYISLSPSITSLIIASPRVKYSVGMDSNSLNGFARIRPNNKIETSFEIEADSLKEILRKLDIDGITGVINGEGNILINLSRLKGFNQVKSIEKGEASLLATRLDITPSAFNKSLSFIPPLKIDNIYTDISLSSGMAKIKRFDMTGDIEGTIAGTVKIIAPHTRSALNLDIKIKPSAKLLQKIGPIITLINNKKGKDGYYNLKIRGTIASPNLIN